MSEKEPCPQCGDPDCTCEKGKCDCTPKAEKTQPSDKYLPKENHKNIEDGMVISKPVNPYVRGEVPIVTEPLIETKKKAEKEIETYAGEAWFPQAIEGIKNYLAYAKVNAGDLTEFGYGYCSYNRAKDGLWAVNYNYSRTDKTLFKTTDANAQAYSFTSEAHSNYSFPVSKHFDEKSAQLACSDYNIFVAAKPSAEDHPVKAFRS